MSKILTILGLVGVVSSSASPVIKNMSPIIENEISAEQKTFEGLKEINLGSEQKVSDASWGNGWKYVAASKCLNLEWNELQIDESIVSKMDYTKSWLKLDTSFWYSDNSGIGNWRNLHREENIAITDSNFDSGQQKYEYDRHHEGRKRNTDHLWKWQVKVNQEGIYFWDYLWTWASGNWFNKATSVAGIKINYFEYHFEFLV